MDMNAVKVALKDLLAAMDSEDKRALQERLAGPAEKPEEEMPGKPCEQCGKGPCACGGDDSMEE